MSDKFTERAQSVLNGAQQVAAEFGHTYIGSEHLLMALVREHHCAAARILAARNISSKQIKESISSHAGLGIKTHPSPADMTPRVKKILESAYASARQTPVGYIGTEHLLYAILEEKDCVASRILAALGVVIPDLKNDILSVLGGGKKPEQKAKQTLQDTGKQLNNYGRNLTQLAEEGRLDPVFGRDKETSRLIEILVRRTKNNPCLLGDPGVGKTAVVEGLAQRLVSGNVPDPLLGKTLFSLDLSAMIAGAKYRGEFEERLKSVIDMLLNRHDIILFIDELHTIVGAGAAEGAVDAANILKPLLARGEIQLIGATTLQEYRRCIEKDAALERRFQPIMLEEPSEEEALHILRNLKEKYETHHSIRISDEALSAAVRLSARYIPDRHLPDKAIDLLDEAAAHLRIASVPSISPTRALEDSIATLTKRKEEAIRAQNFEYAAQLRDMCIEKMNELDTQKSTFGSLAPAPVLTASHIEAVVTAWTGIPATHLTEEESRRLNHLNQTLSQYIIGQPRAIAAISDAIRRSRTGVRDPAKPIGSFLFVGPTGVGKTELSKVLSKILYGRDDALIRFDMSEYRDSISSAKMIGAPPGYVGYEEGGRLTEQVRRHPYSVILFDEIEKAHEDVYHLLLQILDDGILTDSHGHTVSFKNAVIILTSNLGAAHMTKPAASIGFSGNRDRVQETTQMVMGEINRFFPPEFLNRLDEIILFDPLAPDHRHSITSTILKQVTKRLASMDIQLYVNDDAVNFLSDKGFSEKQGARQLRRVITKELETPISQMLLDGILKKNMSLTVGADEKHLIFEQLENKKDR